MILAWWRMRSSSRISESISGNSANLCLGQCQLTSSPSRSPGYLTMVKCQSLTTLLTPITALRFIHQTGCSLSSWASESTITTSTMGKCSSTHKTSTGLEGFCSSKVAKTLETHLFTRGGSLMDCLKVGEERSGKTEQFTSVSLDSAKRMALVKKLTQFQSLRSNQSRFMRRESLHSESSKNK